MSSAEPSEHEPAPLRAFLEGARICLPAALTAVPFGILYGTLAIQNGLGVAESVLMSATVFGGAGQMVGLELFGQKVSPWLIVLSILAVNFRMVLYSAAIGRLLAHWTPLQRAFGLFFITDPQYAESERKGGPAGRVSFAWYMGVAALFYVCWVGGSIAGAVFGNLIPDPQVLGLDFLLPIYFLGLVVDFRKRPLWLPVVAMSAAASIAAFKLIGSPWHVSVGAIAGVALAVVLAPPGREKRA